MKSALLLLGLLVQGAPAQRDIWRECKFETAVVCEATGCKEIKPSLKVYMADYAGEKGQRNGYYYRCVVSGGCDIINQYWVGYGRAGYRIWDAREKGALSRLSPDDKITDVVTLEDVVLISRGKCWDAPPPIILRPTK